MLSFAIVESYDGGMMELTELPTRRIAESSNAGMVELVELSNRRSVEFWTDIPGIDLGLFHHCHFLFFLTLYSV